MPFKWEILEGKILVMQANLPNPPLLTTVNVVCVDCVCVHRNMFLEVIKYSTVLYVMIKGKHTVCIMENEALFTYI